MNTHKKLFLSLSMIACMSTLHGMNEGSSSSNTALIRTGVKLANDETPPLVSNLINNMMVDGHGHDNVSVYVFRAPEKPWYKDPNFYKMVVTSSAAAFLISLYFGSK